MATTLKTEERSIEINEAEIHGAGKMEATNQVAIGLIMTLAAMVGVWGIACFFAGVVKSGGLIDMARLWVGAITGM